MHNSMYGAFRGASLPDAAQFTFHPYDWRKMAGASRSGLLHTRQSLSSVTWADNFSGASHFVEVANLAHPLALDEICRLIDALLAKGYPTIDAVARLLRLSPRTFQRLLHQQGISYSELVDRCRCQAACDWLGQTRRPVHDIAAALGYRDASSFSRAFRRWTGTAPRAFRYQAHRQNTASSDPVSRSAKASG